MKYKGYALAKLRLMWKRESLHGEVVNTRDVITFQGK